MPRLPTARHAFGAATDAEFAPVPRCRGCASYCRYLNFLMQRLMPVPPHSRSHEGRTDRIAAGSRAASSMPDESILL